MIFIIWRCAGTGKTSDVSELPSRQTCESRAATEDTLVMSSTCHGRPDTVFIYVFALTLYSKSLLLVSECVWTCLVEGYAPERPTQGWLHDLSSSRILLDTKLSIRHSNFYNEQDLLSSNFSRNRQWLKHKLAGGHRREMGSLSHSIFQTQSRFNMHEVEKYTENTTINIV